MTVNARTARTGQPTPGPWYTRPAAEVIAALQVDPAAGLSAARARELLDANGPNALPEEKAKPGWRRFLDAVPQLHADHPGRRRRSSPC